MRYSVGLIIACILYNAREAPSLELQSSRGMEVENFSFEAAESKIIMSWQCLRIWNRGLLDYTKTAELN